MPRDAMNDAQGPSGRHLRPGNAANLTGKHAKKDWCTLKTIEPCWK